MEVENEKSFEPLYRFLSETIDIFAEVIPDKEEVYKILIEKSQIFYMHDKVSTPDQPQDKNQKMDWKSKVHDSVTNFIQEES